MKIFLFITVVFMAMFMYGCDPSSGDQGSKDSLDYRPENEQISSVTAADKINKSLPVKKLVIVSGNTRHQLEVEIAANDVDRKLGLMNRTQLAENHGMLFIFQSEGYINFWMKNTLIPLDMLFIDVDGYIKSIAHHALPCTVSEDSDCPRYNSNASVKYVLEINGGLAEKWNIREGDKVTWL